jgi:hypothetical protein
MKKKNNDITNNLDEQDLFNMEENEDFFLGYCDYCKEPLYDYDDYKKHRGLYYCTFCFEQMNTYYDETELDDSEDYPLDGNYN